MQPFKLEFFNLDRNARKNCIIKIREKDLTLKPILEEMELMEDNGQSKLIKVEPNLTMKEE